jgi:hypothetical protein
VTLSHVTSSTRMYQQTVALPDGDAINKNHSKANKCGDSSLRFIALRLLRLCARYLFRVYTRL